jgi:hypothetical protein
MNEKIAISAPGTKASFPVLKPIGENGFVCSYEWMVKKLL